MKGEKIYPDRGKEFSRLQAVIDEKRRFLIKKKFENLLGKMYIRDFLNNQLLEKDYFDTLKGKELLEVYEYASKLR